MADEPDRPAAESVADDNTPKTGATTQSFEEVEFVEEVVYEEVDEGEEESDGEGITEGDKQPSSEFEAVASTEDRVTVDDRSEPGFAVVSEQKDVAPLPVPPAADLRVDSEIRQLEERAQKVAREVQEAAKAASRRFTAGFNSVFGATPGAAVSPTASSEAAPSLSKLTSSFSSWLAGLDATPAARSIEAHHRQVTGALASLLQLAEGEVLHGAFACKLVQTYECLHNDATPPTQMTFAGTLYAWCGGAAFALVDHGHTRAVHLPLPPHARVTRTQEQQAVGDAVRVEVAESSGSRACAFVFASFAAAAELVAAHQALLAAQQGLPPAPPALPAPVPPSPPAPPRQASASDLPVMM